MLAQRGQDLKGPVREPTKPSAPKDLKPATRAPKQAKRRLSFHEKHALETLQKSIAALQAKVRALHESLDDPSLFARQRQAFDQASAALAATQTELAAAESKWLELELLREEIERD
jgi:ATP-binding cassette subfamily F protein uup